MRPPDVLIGVVDVDEAGTRCVCLCGDCTDERRVLGKRVDREALARLHVDPDPNCESRVGGQHLLDRHEKQCTRPLAPAA